LLASFALLTAALGIVSYLLILLLAIACIYLPYEEIAESDAVGVQGLVMLVLGSLIAGTVLWLLFPRRDPFKPVGLPLNRTTQPRLFAEIENIARALNEPMPGEVYLIGDVNAYVVDRGGILGYGSRRIMGIGLPVLGTLTISQFRAIVAHEFAHHYAGDTKFGPWIDKTQVAIVGIFQNIGAERRLARIPVIGMMYTMMATVMKWYFQLSLRAINMASRPAEYRADELACMIAGRQPLIDGLRAMHGASMAWTTYWKTELIPVLNSGAFPGIAEGFSRFSALPRISDQTQRGIAKQIAEAKQNPYDSHPPLRDRMDAAQKIPRELLSQALTRADSNSARTLLDEPTALELRFLEIANTNMKPGSLQSISWEEVGTRVAIPRWKTFAAEYSSFLEGVTAKSIPAQVSQFSKIGDSMRNPPGVILDSQQRARRAGHLFAVGLSLALIDRGWRLVTEPGSFMLQGLNGELNAFEAIDKLSTGKLSADQWIAQCQKLGIADVTLRAAPEGVGVVA
jgi:heat shock protein HtpX